MEATLLSTRGFVRSLFDFRFTSLISAKVIKFVYGLLVCIYSFVATLLLILGLTRGGAVGAAFSIIFIPLCYALYIIWLRIFMEFLIVIFLIGDDVHAIRAGGVGRDATNSARQVMSTAPGTAAESRAPKGWYTDPAETTRQRFWDGNAWTEEFRAMEGSANVTS